MNQRQDKEIRLSSSEGAKHFYEERYAAGYMETWPDWKLVRVRNLIGELCLPDIGAALDYGCGNGVFTQVLIDALPGWKIFGVDISETALVNARSRVPDATFFHSSESSTFNHEIDFVFTHHVLEHVSDLETSLKAINAFLKESAAVLHILPCGNPDSFEHKLCQLRTDGIDVSRGGRFFFEDEGHVRRITSSYLTEHYSMRGFTPVRGLYSCQHAGAINWITASGTEFVSMLTDDKAAVNADAAQYLRSLRRRLMPIAFVRGIKRRFENRLTRGSLHAKSYLRLAALWPIYLIGRVVDHRMVAAAEEEWVTRRAEPNGSEMYLVFRRKASKL